MTSNPRIPRAEITGVYGFLVKKMTRKMLGDVPDPLSVMWHNRKVLSTTMAMNKASKWDACARDLKSYAHMAVAARVGCEFCLDLGYFMVHNEGMDEGKARRVPRWRDSDLFSDLERDVLEYAEAMSQTPPAVTDELSARLLEQLGAPALVELTAFVAFANVATRMNVAFGIKSQGFSSVCELPLELPASRAVGV